MTIVGQPSAKAWLARLWANIHDHLVRPFLETHDPLAQVAWGASIGLFVGLTPTVGIQMYVVTLIWLLCRYGFRVRYNLTIAISMVWITNPVTTLPLYYLFLKTGDRFLLLLGYEVVEMSFAVFKAEVRVMAEGQQDWGHLLLAAGQVFLVEFGWPIVLGSLVYAVPGAIVGYPFTVVTLRKYRNYLARQEGISYEEWRRRHEAKP